MTWAERKHSETIINADTPATGSSKVVWLIPNKQRSMLKSTKTVNTSNNRTQYISQCGHGMSKDHPVRRPCGAMNVFSGPTLRYGMSLETRKSLDLRCWRCARHLEL